MPVVSTAVASQMPPLALPSSRLKVTLIVLPTGPVFLTVTTASTSCWPPPLTMVVWALVDLRLVGLGLITGQIGEKAGERDGDEGACAIGPFKFAEEILRQSDIGLSDVNGGILIDLAGENRIIVANFGAAFVEPLQFEDLSGAGIGNISIDIRIKIRAGAIKAYGHKGLQSGAAH